MHTLCHAPQQLWPGRLHELHRPLHQYLSHGRVVCGGKVSSDWGNDGWQSDSIRHAISVRRARVQVG